MAIYKNFSGNQTNAVLIPKNGVRSGSISTVLITNKHDSTTMTTTLDLHDGTNTYILYNKIDIPAKTSLVLTNNVSFNVREFSL